MKFFLESLTGPAPGSFLGDEKGFGDLGAGLGTRHWPASRRIKQPATVSSHSILQGCIFFVALDPSRLYLSSLLLVLV